jgi:L-seryl-tRNA(Ser) seleniumtransferase
LTHNCLPSMLTIPKSEFLSIIQLSIIEVSLVVITGVSSELEVINEFVLMETIRLAKEYGVTTFLDDAYGARLRPIIYGQPKTLETGVDIGITSCDKAGLGWPRAGLMAGTPDLIDRVITRAEELGLEARPPLALGVCTSLAKFDPNKLRCEVELGEKIYEQLSERFGKERVKRTGLGATIPEEDAWEIVQALRPGGEQLPFLPAEITAGIGIYWLEHYGMITVNALGQPGARVSLRFKPDPSEVERFGGISALIEAIDDGLRYIAEKAGSLTEMKQLILGE